MKIGLIGCGLIGRKRAAALDAGHSIVIVADVRLERAREFADSFEIGKSTDKPEEVFSNSEVEAVFIATTHDVLARYTVAAIEAGKHVLVEKPGARNAAELRPVILAAREKGITVKVGFNHRFHGGLLKAKEIVESGVLGPLMFIRGRYGHGGRIGYEKEWRADPDISGGGELLDQGIHLIDLSRWFLGDLRPDSGSLQTYFWDMNVDDNAFICLKSESGQVAWLHSTWTEWKNLFSFEIYGISGKLHIEGLGGSYGTERLHYYKMLPEMGPPVTKTFEYPGKDTSWQSEFGDFCDSISGGREPCGTVEDAAAALTIVDSYYQRGDTE